MNEKKKKKKKKKKKIYYDWVSLESFIFKNIQLDPIMIENNLIGKIYVGKIRDIAVAE